MKKCRKVGSSREAPVSRSVTSRPKGFPRTLDFTLREESHSDEEFLRSVLEEVIAWVIEQSGLNIPADQLEFDIYKNPGGRLNCQGKIAYRGPVSPTSGGWPKIKLDLTADERLVLPSVRREVFHPYTDRPEGVSGPIAMPTKKPSAKSFGVRGTDAASRSLRRCDLDRHTDSRPTASVLRDVLQQKCVYKAIPVPTLESVLSHRQSLEAMWSDMLAHQLPVLPPLKSCPPPSISARVICRQQFLVSRWPMRPELGKNA